MEKYAPNWINLCPVNFVKLSLLLDKTDDIDATLLYMRLLYALRGSKLKNKEGRVCITRTLDAMAKWLNCKAAKVSKLLKKLERLNLIGVEAGLWYGKKQLFISVLHANLESLPVNIRILEELKTQTGSVAGAILLGLIAFRLNKTILHHNHEDWCCLTRLELATMLHLSLGTIDKLIQNLLDKNLIQVEHRIFSQQRRLHFSIPLTVYWDLNSRLNAQDQKSDVAAPKALPVAPLIEGNDALFSPMAPTAAPTLGLSPEPTTHAAKAMAQDIATLSTESTHLTDSENSLPGVEGSLPNPQKSHKNKTLRPLFCRSPGVEPTKNAVPIRISTHSNTVNNIMAPKVKKRAIPYSQKNTIIFNNIGQNLSNEQGRYLQSALDQTIANAQLSISSKEALYQELRFSILNPEQRLGVTTFQHAVHRCMKLLREKTWRTPKGFNRYSDYGQNLSAYRDAQLKAHEAYKKASGVGCLESYRDAATKHHSHDEKHIDLEQSTAPHHAPVVLCDERFTRFALNEAKEIISLQQSSPTIDGTQAMDDKIAQRLSRIEHFVVLGANKERIHDYLLQHEVALPLGWR